MGSSFNDIRCDSLSLGKLFDGFLHIPRLQRDSDWNEEQVTELLNYIAGESDGGDTDERFIGIILTKRSDNHDGRDDVIDGQQRIMTVFLTFCALARVIDLHACDNAWRDINRLRLARQAIMDHISKLNDHYIGIDKNPFHIRLQHSDEAMHAYIGDLVAKLDDGVGNAPLRNICTYLHEKYCKIYTWLGHYLERKGPELSAARLLSLYRIITTKTYILNVVAPDAAKAIKILQAMRTGQ